MSWSWWSRIVGAVLAWWCLALTAQGVVRHAEWPVWAAGDGSAARDALLPQADFGRAADAVLSQAEEADGGAPAPHGPLPLHFLRCSTQVLVTANQAVIGAKPLWPQPAPTSCHRQGSSGGPRAP